jgi:hypothetical protein
VAIVFVLNVISELILREKGEPEECLQENQVISACGDQRTSQFHFILHHTAFFMGHMGIVSYFFGKRDSNEYHETRRKSSFMFGAQL